jgi:hypothetical protein
MVLWTKRRHMSSQLRACGSIDRPDHLITDGKGYVRKYGKKNDHAEEWQIPILNHLWLEECFIRWCDLAPCREAFLAFPPGVNFLDFLSERSLEHGTVETWAEREDVQQERREALGLPLSEAATSEVIAGTPENDAMETDRVPELEPAQWTCPPQSTYTSTPAKVQAALVPASRKKAQPTSPTTPRPPPKTPPRPASIVTPRTPGSSRQRNGTAPSNILVGSSKRKAATAATDRLHNEIGPDMMKWEKERKRLGKKREREVADDGGDEDDDDDRPSKVVKPKARKSPASDNDDDAKVKKGERKVKMPRFFPCRSCSVALTRGKHKGDTGFRF